MTMPPEQLRVAGGARIGTFFATVPLDGRLDLIRLVPTRANGQPTLAAYARSPETGAFLAYGIMVFAIGGDRVVGITGFAGQPDLFPLFGLATQLD
jgi:RNA polymerase sigma-70 factor (ECF subfamily)